MLKVGVWKLNACIERTMCDHCESRWWVGRCWLNTCFNSFEKVHPQFKKIFPSMWKVSESYIQKAPYYNKSDTSEDK